MFILLLLYLFSVLLLQTTYYISEGCYPKSEIILQYVIFPLSNIIAPFILTVWLFKNWIRLGKLFLIFNYCAFWSSFVSSIYGIIEIINFGKFSKKCGISLGHNLLFNIPKIALPFLTYYLSYFGTIYITQSDSLTQQKRKL